MSGRLLRSTIAGVLLAGLLAPVANGLCAGGVMCPMMERAAELEAPCHPPASSVSSNHDCCMRSGEVATERPVDQTLRKLVVLPWFESFVGITAADDIETLPPTPVQPRSRSLFTLHSQYLT